MPMELQKAKVAELPKKTLEKTPETPPLAQRLDSSVASTPRLSSENASAVEESGKDAFGKGEEKLSSEKSAKELQYGRVSLEELVQVDRGMLSAAGINMDAEKHTLLHTTLSLQEQLKEIQTTLLLEQKLYSTFSAVIGMQISEDDFETRCTVYSMLPLKFPSMTDTSDSGTSGTAACMASYLYYDVRKQCEGQ
ncbi:hypothetical protein H6P81_003793 [Aristolochia fimbriata]|uniref:Uncharacterized protein n=1 Tax=Aristolochia fimbriata TaxID=158543 RepID=A0AAV7FDL4_ARIFI|nr:hypothetical protein H6P81_003793 [Aristolochia fimbriata]